MLEFAIIAAANLPRHGQSVEPAAPPALRFSLIAPVAETSQNLYLSRIDLTGGADQRCMSVE